MAFDPYSYCPCGSGKKFKWCCQPIHQEIDKAFRQDEEGQHEAAIRTMDEVIAAHSSNPEVYGRKAMLLYANDRLEEAEETLEKAFQVNPHYPFGYFLRGRFRMFEGEYPGALLLFRKAAEHYDPQAREPLSALYAAIAECESRLNRPVASRAALEIAIKNAPTVEEYRKSLESVFGKNSTMPASACKAYTYKSMPAQAADSHKQAWQKALQISDFGRLTDALTAFEQLTAADPNDGPAWYNLALTRAWLGDNAGTLQALDQYIQRETDESEAAAAWALGEVLRCGTGMEKTDADYVEHNRVYQFRDGTKISEMLVELEKEQRLLGAQMHEEQRVFTAMVADKPQLLTAQPAAQTPRFGAHLTIMGPIVSVRGVNRDKVTAICHDLETKSKGALADSKEGAGPAYFSDILSEGMTFPLAAKTEEEAQQQIAEGLAKYLEDAWVHRPLKSLSGVPPIDAGGSFNLRKKLIGVVQFLEECAVSQRHTYDFNRLRHKLGLSAPSTPTTTDAAGTRDIRAMNAADLAALSVDSLSDTELEQAYQTARNLDAQELSGAFLKVLVNRPPQTDKPDRFTWYQQLIQQSLSANDKDAALEYVDAGEKHDCEHNEGRRRNDYELWRGRVHCKRGETDAARDVFDNLIARVPSEMKYRGTAAEAMLSARALDHAARYAQEGLEQARKKQDRDSEGHFMELLEAAKR
jgi:tetratricopeptide (TPR) repeat protein